MASKVRIAVLLGLATLAVNASSASAVITTTKESTTLSFGESEAPIVECPDGQSIVSGGFGAPGLDPIGTEGHYIQPFFSSPWSQTWTAQGRNGNPVDGTFTVYAVCSDALGEPVMKSSSGSAVANDTTRIDAECDSGQTALAAGFGPPQDFNQSGLVYPVDSRRVGDDAWKSVSLNTATESRPIDIYLLCTEANLEITEASKTAKKKNNKVASATAKCKRGQVAVSGGYDGVSSEKRDSFLFESRPVGRRGWKVSAAVYSDVGKPTKVKAYAYCAKASKLE